MSAARVSPEPAAIGSPTLHVGVFDSGVGGLSVLRALRRHLPGARLSYLADSAHAPYGERDAAFVAERSRAMTSVLVERGAQLVVVACNTATALAIDGLREAHPSLPFVGVEPGIKPALAATRVGRVGVMATSATLSSERFRRLLQAQAALHPSVDVALQPCPGLARALEQGPAGMAQVAELAQRYARPLREARVDVVVLGCTHYPFAAAEIAAALGPDVTLLDTAVAVAQQAARLAANLEPLAITDASTTLGTTGDPQALADIARAWLDFPFDVPPLRIDT
ncbi:glutamate racemase [Caldimonas sp. KR1-144]|uniref:glutamate racemase n=1 Tax=Caldimonas sp. KR1-144 TaxID=3400911 RepID=UPI003C0AE45C